MREYARRVCPSGTRGTGTKPAPRGAPDDVDHPVRKFAVRTVGVDNEERFARVAIASHRTNETSCPKSGWWRYSTRTTEVEM